MAKRIGSSKRKTRQIMRKHKNRKGKISFTAYFQKFNIGDTVALKCEPAVQKGMYFPRFHGKTAVVTGVKGKCYEVRIKDMDKEKTLIVHPVHLKKI
jgi:large subunit ribosomal protein L21e